MLNPSAGFGYRTEAYSGSGVRDAEAVIRFEILELGNTDIPDTLLNQTMFIQNAELRKDMEWLIRYIEDNGGPGDEDVFEDPNDTRVLEIIKRILPEVRKHSLDIKYALWLADKDEVLKDNENGGYGGNESNIDKYPVSPVCLSNLGNMGCLFGYVEYPRPIREF